MPISPRPLAAVTRTYAPSCVTRNPKRCVTQSTHAAHTTRVPKRGAGVRCGCVPIFGGAVATNARVRDAKTNTLFSVRKSRARHVVWQANQARDACHPEGDDCDDGTPLISHPNTTTFTRTAKAVGSVGILAFLCKLIGLARETCVAGAFGVGAVVDAHAHASLIPLFVFVTLGGLNGPVHSVLSGCLLGVRANKNDEENDANGTETKNARADAEKTASCVVTAVTLAAFFASVFACVFAPSVARVSSPGLSPGLYVSVTQQLRIMSPIIALAAINVVAMAKMTALGKTTAAVASPAVASVCVVCVVCAHVSGVVSVRPEIVIAVGTTIGAVLQCAFLKIAAGMDKTFHHVAFEVSSLFAVQSRAVKSVARNLGKACLTSGVMQIASTCDLFTASFIPTAAAGLGYATLLAMTPLGILSTALITPLAPLFSLNKHPANRAALQTLVGAAVKVTFTATTFAAAILIPLASPLISFVFQRNAFDANATALVSAMFAVFVAGGFFFVTREILVRVFYVLEDASAPFCVAVVAVGTNALLNFAFTGGGGLWQELSLGAPGIALSTVVTAGVSAFLLARVLRATLRLSDENETETETESLREAPHFVKAGVAGVVAFAATSVYFTLASKHAPASAAHAAARLCAAAAAGSVSFVAAAAALRLENPMTSFEEYAVDARRKVI